ncbi:MAG: hypothetical protein A3G76_11505 [Acidobacteria bacterium RIFCSPLOWO2_12_FULL_65_11]|nr:MAG: hypothetical protein A3H95_10120 [Acidobacteria bacterium RIFCSPLOWO2_02_FULL_64_15]OFW29242.1 MAG: hypothetical protein A3G76_11505 [Acidobacteria bacterium RIFCSPLOWO2_12_FULL_65_11]
MRFRPASWRGSLGWSATSAPVALLLLSGIAVGPQGINLLSEAVLSVLDSVVPVALAALGVLVGLGAGHHRAGDRYMFAAACLETAATAIVVAGGTAFVLSATIASTSWPVWTLPLAAGLCAATSLTLPTGNPLEPRTAAARVAELGVLLPIVAGGPLIASLREGAPAAGLILVAQASGVTLVLAAAGWLLLTRASGETEERVFAIAVLLLVGGVTDALSVSALLGGLVAGVFWRYAGRLPREAVSRDVLFVQHPLLVLVLLVAGAHTDLLPLSLGLGGAYAALRVAGTLAGGLMARQAVGARVPSDLGLHLLSPGVFGVAFALNAVRAVGSDASILLTMVVIGTIGSELVALFLPPQGAGT